MPGQIFNGDGIKFPAVQTPSADVNILDDYEEGVWTPEIKFDGNAVGMVYAAQNGFYTKIGNVVHAWAEVILSAKGSSSGIATISTPFTAVQRAVASLYLLAVTYTGAPQATAQGGTAIVNLQYITEAGNISNMTQANFSDTSRVYLTIVFIA